MSGEVRCFPKVTLLGGRGQSVTPGLAWSQSLDCSVACIWVVAGTGYKEPCPLDSPNSLSMYASRRTAFRVPKCHVLFS